MKCHKTRTLLGSPLLAQPPGGEFWELQIPRVWWSAFAAQVKFYDVVPEHNQLPRLSASNFRLSSHVLVFRFYSLAQLCLVTYQKLTLQETSVSCVRQIQLATAVSCSFSFQFVHACAMNLLLSDSKSYLGLVLALSVARDEFLLSTSPIGQRRTLHGPSRHWKESSP